MTFLKRMALKLQLLLLLLAQRLVMTQVELKQKLTLML